MCQNLENSFLCSITYTQNDIQTIRKYLSLKGVNRYDDVVSFCRIAFSIEKPEWNLVSKTYRYDKRVCFLLMRYLSMTEEWIKACLSNLISFSFSSIEEGIQQMDAYFVLPKKDKDSIKQAASKGKPTNFYELLDCLLLSSLIELLVGIRDPFKIKQDIQQLIKNCSVIEALRNSVFHGRFLLGKEFAGNNLYESLAIFSNCLPRGFSSQKPEAMGFWRELKDAKNGLFLEKEVGKILLLKLNRQDKVSN